MLTPILMYHDVAPPGTLPEGAAASWTVTPDCFVEHLEMLAAAGWTGVSVGRWLELRAAPHDIRPVVITFDDGYLGNIENAVPALMDRGWGATFFVVSGKMGREHYGRPGDWAAAARAGMEIASHTASHPFLGLLPTEGVRRELEDSRMALEDTIGRPVRGLSWPNGDAPPGGIGMLEECGYDWAATSRAGFAGPGTDGRSLPRLAVRAWHNANGLERLVDTRWPNRLQLAAWSRAKRFARAALGRRRYAELQNRVME